LKPFFACILQRVFIGVAWHVFIGVGAKQHGHVVAEHKTVFIALHLAEHLLCTRFSLLCCAAGKKVVAMHRTVFIASLCCASEARKKGARRE
jgi:hypothetical protein